MTDTSKAVAIRNGSTEIAPRRAENTAVLWTSTGTRNLTRDEARALALVGDYYGLDPAMGEILLVEKGAYITAAGYMTIAHTFPEFEGLETWPLSTEERKRYQIDPKDQYAYGCRVYRRNWRVPGVAVASAGNGTISNPKIFKWAMLLA